MPILFADDTNVLFHSKSLTNLEDIVNTELKRLADWFNANKLSLNIKKTKFMLFHTKQRTKHIGDFSICINHEKIDRVEKIRFLGLTLQENISWDEHCNLVTNKISSVVGILYKIRIFLPIKTLLQIYNSLILPHLYYGILAWGGAPCTTLTKIETIQKRAMRVINGSPYNSHTSPIFAKFNCLKLEDIFKLQCNKLVLKSFLGIIPQYHKDQLCTNAQKYARETRQKLNIHINATTKTLDKQRINYKVGHCWNTMGESEQINLSNVNIYKAASDLKRLFISQYSTNHRCENFPNCYSCRYL